MNNLLLVGVMKRVANSQKKSKSFGDAQPMGIAVTVQRLPCDIFHDEIRQAVLGCTPVHQTGDVRVVERRQNLTLFTKAPEDKVSVHATLHQFNCHAHGELVINAQCLIDRTHTTASYFALNSINTEAAPDHGINIVVSSNRPDST